MRGRLPTCERVLLGMKVFRPPGPTHRVYERREFNFPVASDIVFDLYSSP